MLNMLMTTTSPGMCFRRPALFLFMIAVALRHPDMAADHPDEKKRYEERQRFAAEEEKRRERKDAERHHPHH